MSVPSFLPMTLFGCQHPSPNRLTEADRRDVVRTISGKNVFELIPVIRKVVPGTPAKD
jgi:hypothetical protein